MKHAIPLMLRVQVQDHLLQLNAIAVNGKQSLRKPGMETLANLKSFVRSAETGGFSAAARRLSLIPAAVSRNVAMLERNLGIRLFQRSTRKLTLTEAGEPFLLAIRGNLDELQASIASVATDRGEPAGVLIAKCQLSHVMKHCPLWVISGHLRCKGTCPLYPQKRTFRSALGFLLIRIPLLSPRLTIE